MQAFRFDDEKKEVQKPAPAYVWPMVAAVSTTLLIIGVQGCSLFGMKSDPGPGDPTFHATASSDQLPAVVPVEIAGDIQKIARGEQNPNEPFRGPAGSDEDEESSSSTGSKSGGSAHHHRGPSSAEAEMNFEADGTNRKYTVRSGDTLMKIAYQAYGNLYRWRDIYNANKTKIVDFNAVPAGTVLTINGNEYIKIVRNGLPYLIRRHDTLTSISSDLYGRASFWRDLWNNNRQMIHDPNKIYAGFTLYYKEHGKREKTEAVQNRMASSKAASVQTEAKVAEKKADDATSMPQTTVKSQGEVTSEKERVPAAAPAPEEAPKSAPETGPATAPETSSEAPGTKLESTAPEFESPKAE